VARAGPANESRSCPRSPFDRPAIAILHEMKPLRDLSGGSIFPSQKHESPLCSNVFLKLLERMKYEVTGHGFRSSFKTWAEEETDYPNSVIEAAQPHIVRDKTERSFICEGLGSRSGRDCARIGARTVPRRRLRPPSSSFARRSYSCRPYAFRAGVATRPLDYSLGLY
jgi:hypothetical protein